MTDQPENLDVKLLQEMRGDIARMNKRHDETNLKIETLAGTMVSMRNDINDLRSSVDGIWSDVRMIAIAIDGHAARLDKIGAILDAVKH